MAEAYLTERNSLEKARRWIGQVERHPRRRMSFKFDMSSSALLVLDMQKFFLDRSSHAFVPSGRIVIPNIQKLTKAFRYASRPIIFTRHSLLSEEKPGIMGKFWRDVVREGSSYSELDPQLGAEENDLVVRKTRYSAFFNTKLETILRKKRVGNVVVTGVTTHLCCESTARDAFMRDFEVYFVADGTASWTEDLHLSSLKTVSDGFGMVVTTGDVLDSFGGV